MTVCRIFALSGDSIIEQVVRLIASCLLILAVILSSAVPVSANTGVPKGNYNVVYTSG